MGDDFFDSIKDVPIIPTNKVLFLFCPLMHYYQAVLILWAKRLKILKDFLQKLSTGDSIWNMGST